MFTHLHKIVMTFTLLLIINFNVYTDFNLYIAEAQK